MEARGRREPGAQRWHETVLQWSSPQQFDKVLNISIYTAALAMLVVFTYTYVIAQPTIKVVNTEHCMVEVTADPQVRAQRRLHNRAFELMAAQCNDTTSVLTSNNLEVNGKPYPYRIAYMCRLGIRMQHPVTLKRGSHVGKCTEMHNGVVKNKTRHFPIVANTSDDKQHMFDNLPSACEYEHAMERLNCMW